MRNVHIYRARVGKWVLPLALALICCLSITWGGKVFAQYNPDAVYITLDPEEPQPKATVQATVESTSVDLDRSLVVWTVNGKRLSGGVGAKTITFTNGSIGVKTTVSASIQPVSGPSYTASVTLIPQAMDVVWEARTYTPSFYRGKALYTDQSTVVYTALPTFVDESGKSIDPRTLVYDWYKDGDKLDGSGYGKQSISIGSSLISRPYILSVHATTLDGKITANRIIQIAPDKPVALMYEDNPLYGILFNNALVSQKNYAGDEINIKAYPYFMAAGSRTDATLQYLWRLGGNLVNDGQTTPDIILRKESASSDTVPVQVDIANTAGQLQDAQSSFLIRFTKQQGSAF